MLYWALVFLVVALIAGLFGFGGIASASAGIAQILFFVFLVLLVISLGDVPACAAAARRSSIDGAPSASVVVALRAGKSQNAFGRPDLLSVIPTVLPGSSCAAFASSNSLDHDLRLARRASIERVGARHKPTRTSSLERPRPRPPNPRSHRTASACSRHLATSLSGDHTRSCMRSLRPAARLSPHAGAGRIVERLGRDPGARRSPRISTVSAASAVARAGSR